MSLCRAKIGDGPIPTSSRLRCAPTGGPGLRGHGAGLTRSSSSAPGSRQPCRPGDSRSRKPGFPSLRSGGWSTRRVPAHARRTARPGIRISSGCRGHPRAVPKIDDGRGVDLTFVARAHRGDLDRQGPGARTGAGNQAAGRRAVGGMRPLKRYRAGTASAVPSGYRAKPAFLGASRGDRGRFQPCVGDGQLAAATWTKGHGTASVPVSGLGPARSRINLLMRSATSTPRDCSTTSPG
jgi:hypothetical protein